MAKIIRKYLVVLLTDSSLCHGARGIEFSTAGREIFTGFVTKEPGFTIKWNNKIFLKRGTHTTRKLVEENSIWLTTVIVRYVEVDCTDLNSILEEKPRTRHQPTNNPYAAVLGNKNRDFFERQILPLKDEE